MPTIFDAYTIPLSEWIDTVFGPSGWLVTNYRWVFQGIKTPVQEPLEAIDSFLIWLPPELIIVTFAVAAWRMVGWALAVLTVLGLTLLGFLGIWDLTMTTLAIIGTAVIVCAIIGAPLGILAARSQRFETALRPVLDAMQTIPPFVYLIPVVMLFSAGKASGTIAVIIFALPPIIRLTNLGIRQVQAEVVEAGYAFGATPRQVLLDIQLPLALRTILAGLNQTLMLALSMVVIASMINAGGLGMPVRRGLNNLEVGTGFVGGLGIVVLAMVLDRITQAMGRPSREPSLLRRGLNILMAMFRPQRPAKVPAGGSE